MLNDNSKNNLIKENILTKKALFHECKVGLGLNKINVIHHLHSYRGENHAIISKDEENS